jgi:NAD(P)-dependent dehydrogenase (short-subunit alcohol dehydrogenase family)
MDKTFTGKVVIITGASSGIGSGTALEFAKLGAKLVLCGRKTDQLQLVKEQCMQNGLKADEVVLVCGDISDAEVQSNIINNAMKNFGQIDVLVNNAGILLLKPVVDMTMEDFNRIFQVNLNSVIALTLKALPHLTKTKGNIVNVSSGAGYTPAVGFMAYSISKSALDTFTKTLAYEMAPKGVRVNSVLPGVTPTNLFRELNVPADPSNELFQNCIKMHPLGKLCEVNEVAQAIIFLASNKASFTTGHLLSVDGGILIHGIKF